MKHATIPALVAILMPGLPALAADGETCEPAKGRDLYQLCESCHATQGASSATGPSLAGFFGRRAALVEDYDYSDALLASGLVWDRATLHRWLEKPSRLVPGTTMTFIGMRVAEQRAALICYLETLAAE